MARAPATPLNFSIFLYEIPRPWASLWGELNFTTLLFKESHAMQSRPAAFVLWRDLNWMTKHCGGVFIIQGSGHTILSPYIRGQKRQHLNGLPAPLPCEFSGVKGRCLAPFLLLKLCQDISHGKAPWETEAHLFFFEGTHWTWTYYLS